MSLRYTTIFISTCTQYVQIPSYILKISSRRRYVSFRAAAGKNNNRDNYDMILLIVRHTSTLSFSLVRRPANCPILRPLWKNVISVRTNGKNTVKYSNKK